MMTKINQIEMKITYQMYFMRMWTIVALKYNQYWYVFRVAIDTYYMSSLYSGSLVIIWRLGSSGNDSSTGTRFFHDSLELRTTEIQINSILYFIVKK